MPAEAVSLEERARRYVAKMEAAVSGSNGHNTTFHVACVLVQGFGLSPEQAWPLMQEYNQRCSPPWSDKELRHKLNGADKAGARRGRGWLSKGGEWTPSRQWNEYHHVSAEEKKAVFDAEKLKGFAKHWARTVDLVWLANRSAVDPATVTAAGFLKLLYPDGEKVGVFTSEHSATIGKGAVLWPDCGDELPTRGPEPRPCGVWFLAQPVDGQYHPTDDLDPDTGKPKMSFRNWRAITAWRYMLIESDKADVRQWLGAIVQLPLRITAMYTSGGRSVHALVRVDARTKGEWDTMKASMANSLTTLGADRAALSAVRLTRLPGCWRHGKMFEVPNPNYTPENGEPKKLKRYDRFPHPKLQKLLYVNPNPNAAPLLDHFPRRNVVEYWTDLAAKGVADSDETGGAWIADGLRYYAPVSADCEAALMEMEEGQ